MIGAFRILLRPELGSPFTIDHISVEGQLPEFLGGHAFDGFGIAIEDTGFEHADIGLYVLRFGIVTIVAPGDLTEDDLPILHGPIDAIETLVDLHELEDLRGNRDPARMIDLLYLTDLYHVICPFMIFL